VGKVNGILLLGLLTMCWLMATDVIAQVATIELTKPDDIRDAAAISQAIDGMSAKVTQCVQDKVAPPQMCSCRFPKELADVKALYEETLQRHPDWRDKPVSLRTSSGGSQMVSFLGLRSTVRRAPARVASTTTGKAPLTALGAALTAPTRLIIAPAVRRPGISFRGATAPPRRRLPARGSPPRELRPAKPLVSSAGA
jgi:hypothetical protein